MPKKTEQVTPKESASSVKSTNCILYAQSFEDIEEQVQEVMKFFIFDDKQLDVYSNKIADLIIRICCEIESISKDLCRAKEEHEKRHKFDYSCLCSENDLECVAMYICERTVRVSDENRVIFPFRNMEHRVI